MNERIRELAVQADAYAWEQIDEGADYDEQPRYFAEKFAELIVQECLVTLDSITAADRDALWIARKVIADHFGVEE